MDGVPFFPQSISPSFGEPSKRRESGKRCTEETARQRGREKEGKKEHTDIEEKEANTYTRRERERDDQKIRREVKRDKSMEGLRERARGREGTENERASTSTHTYA